MRTLTPLVGSVGQNTRGAVGQRENGFVDVASDLARVDVERGNDGQVGRSVVTDSPMHQAHCVFRRLVRVVVNSLHKRTRTVAYADDGNPDRGHPHPS